MEACRIECLIEALLFVAEEPVTPAELAQALETDVEQVVEAVERLEQSLSERGLRLARLGERLQMVAAPEAGAAIERFLGLDLSMRLSAAALETLAIIAYRQPITRAQIDTIRGVNSDAVIRSLRAKGLVAPVGRLEQAGRPVLWGTTFEFLHYFGIRSLAELPPLPEGEDANGTAPPSDAATDAPQATVVAAG